MSQPVQHPRGGISAPVAAALAAWLGVQLVALGLSAIRVMWWSRAPRAGEQLALVVIVIAQVATASLLFPILFHNLRSTMLAIVTAWPLGELASFLADAPMGKLWMGEIYVSAWLVTLYVWARAIEKQNSSTKVLAAAFAGMLSIGGPILWYLRAEFGLGDGKWDGVSAAGFGPVAGGVSQILPDRAIGSAWGVLVCLFALGALAWVSKRFKWGFSRQVIP